MTFFFSIGLTSFSLKKAIFIFGFFFNVFFVIFNLKSLIVLFIILGLGLYTSVFNREYLSFISSKDIFLLLDFSNFIRFILSLNTLLITGVKLYFLVMSLIIIFLLSKTTFLSFLLNFFECVIFLLFRLVLIFIFIFSLSKFFIFDNFFDLLLSEDSLFIDNSLLKI